MPTGCTLPTIQARTSGGCHVATAHAQRGFGDLMLGHVQSVQAYGLWGACEGRHAMSLLIEIASLVYPSQAITFTLHKPTYRPVASLFLHKP